MAILTACGSSADNSQKQETIVKQPEATSMTVESDENVSETNDTAEDSKIVNNETDSVKIAVVYFSGTGNTKTIAEMIAEETGADIFEIIPTQAYTEEDLNYNDEDSRVSREHENPSLRHGEYTKDVANWKDYDMVFIGYPIWWQQAAWTVEPFVKGHDFSGKIVIPFATSAMSDIGDSGENLALLAGRKGKWLDGRRFSGDASTDEVHEWLQSLDLSK